MKPYFVRTFSTGAAVILIDQLGKGWAQTHLKDGEVYAILGQNFLQLSRHSCSAQQPFSQRYLPWVAFLLLLTVALIRVKTNHLISKAARTETTGFVLMLAGAVSNLASRFGQGSVTSMLSVYVGGSEYLPFSIADLSVLTGVGLLLRVYGKWWLNNGMQFAE